LAKHGLREAIKLAGKHYDQYRTPFIHDTYQLAHVVGTYQKALFELSKNASHHYKRITLQKKNGGTRVIHAPDCFLKPLQTMILHNILSKIDVSPYATAYIKGKQLADNAKPHTNHKYLLKMDITDFFGSITFLEVISAAFPSTMYPKQIGTMLTSLCCWEDVLPQGAPTSPTLSNIVMKRFDDILGDWCQKHGVTYTRYCDDLTFSANTPLYGVYRKAKAMLEKRGFEVNEKKTKFVTNASSQRVTGLTVNEKVSIPKEYKRQLRQELYYAIKFGLDGSILHGDKTEYIHNGVFDTAGYYAHLNGKLQYVLQVEPHNTWFAEAARRLYEQYYYD
jgi:retron-type reverse transcriptase